MKKRISKILLFILYLSVAIILSFKASNIVTEFLIVLSISMIGGIHCICIETVWEILEKNRASKGDKGTVLLSSNEDENRA